jgi:hypothetical protein
LFSFVEYVKSKLTQAQFDTLFSFALVTFGFAIGIAGLVLWASGSKKYFPFFCSLLNNDCI